MPGRRHNSISPRQQGCTLCYWVVYIISQQDVVCTMLVKFCCLDCCPAGVEVRLEAVPEMGYDPFAEPPTGEVCIRGPGVFSGYYKQSELTKESMGKETGSSME